MVSTFFKIVSIVPVKEIYILLQRSAINFSEKSNLSKKLLTKSARLDFFKMMIYILILFISQSQSSCLSVSRKV